MLVASLALIAFAFQSYLTQTHVHLAPPGIAAEQSGAGSLANASGATLKFHQRTAPKDKTPGDDNPAKCPLCQAVGYAGHFVTTVAAALLLPAAAISMLPLATAILSSRETPSHNWQSRGPPHS